MTPGRHTFCRYWIWIALFCAPLGAEEAADLLRRAWSEYQFLSMETAEQLFRQARERPSGPEEKLEATVGLAMVMQYRERNPDPGQAESLYREALTLGPEDTTEELIRLNLAKLLLAGGDDAGGMELLDRLIADSLDTVYGQEALRRKLLLTMGPYGSGQSLRVADETAERIAGLEASPDRPQLLPLLHSQLGNIYFWGGEYRKAVDHLEAFSRLGTADSTSFGSQVSNLYRLARIWEEKLGNPRQAGRYYRRLVTEYPNSAMSYFALTRAIAAGSISREDVEALGMNGVTDAILDELFRASGEEGAR